MVRDQLALIEQPGATDLDDAGLRLFKPIAAAQERALARAAWSDHHHHLRRFHIEIDAFQYRMVAKGFAQIADPNDCGIAHCTMPPIRSLCSMCRRNSPAALVSSR